MEMETMEELWFICKNRWKNECIPEVAFCWRPKEIDGCIQIPQWPEEEKLKKINARCKYCEHRFFELRINDLSEKKCPVCNSDDFFQIKDSEINADDEKIVSYDFLKCGSCGTPVVLIKLH